MHSNMDPLHELAISPLVKPMETMQAPTLFWIGMNCQRGLGGWFSLLMRWRRSMWDLDLNLLTDQSGGATLIW